MDANNKIRTFKDLLSWQEAHKLVLQTYKLSSKFPTEERFGLTNQIRRAVVSITSNLAEGFGRYSSKDKNHFYSIAKTSLSEIENQFIIAKDLSYITLLEFSDIESKILSTNRLIGGLIKSSKTKLN